MKLAPATYTNNNPRNRVVKLPLLPLMHG